MLKKSTGFIALATVCVLMLACGDKAEVPAIGDIQTAVAPVATVAPIPTITPPPTAIPLPTVAPPADTSKRTLYNLAYDTFKPAFPEASDTWLDCAASSISNSYTLDQLTAWDTDPDKQIEVVRLVINACGMP